MNGEAKFRDEVQLTKEAYEQKAKELDRKLALTFNPFIEVIDEIDLYCAAVIEKLKLSEPTCKCRTVLSISSMIPLKGHF